MKVESTQRCFKTGLMAVRLVTRRPFLINAAFRRCKILRSRPLGGTWPKSGLQIGQQVGVKLQRILGGG